MDTSLLFRRSHLCSEEGSSTGQLPKSAPKRLPEPTPSCAFFAALGVLRGGVVLLGPRNRFDPDTPISSAKQFTRPSWRLTMVLSHACVRHGRRSYQPERVRPRL